MDIKTLFTLLSTEEKAELSKILFKEKRIKTIVDFIDMNPVSFRLKGILMHIKNRNRHEFINTIGHQEFLDERNAGVKTLNELIKFRGY